MEKDSRLSFRVRSHLKKTLETIAASEGRSVAQVCEAFLIAGCENYKEEGMAFIGRVLGRTKPKLRQS
jgi:hypothetical protein